MRVPAAESHDSVLMDDVSFDIEFSPSRPSASASENLFANGRQFQTHHPTSAFVSPSSELNNSKVDAVTASNEPLSSPVRTFLKIDYILTDNHNFNACHSFQHIFFQIQNLPAQVAAFADIPSTALVRGFASSDVFSDFSAPKVFFQIFSFNFQLHWTQSFHVSICLGLVVCFIAADFTSATNIAVVQQSVFAFITTTTTINILSCCFF
jgi:hypothetical protein